MNSPVAIIGISQKLSAQLPPRDFTSFDADLFGIPANEAVVVAPQHRLLLERVWAALENAAYGDGQFNGKIGIYAAIDGDDRYLRSHLLPYPHLLDPFSQNAIRILTSSDLAPLWVSLKLNLNGPCLRTGIDECAAITVLHIACQGLHNGDCDMAVSGIVRLNEEPAGPFFVLKSLPDALTDGDSIKAVIGGSAYTRSGTDHSGALIAGFDRQTLGHIEIADSSASSLAGALIKVTQMIEQRSIPGTPTAPQPVRAGVVALGLAGSSAHLVLEEPPESSGSQPSRPWQVLSLSAKSEPALESMVSNLRNHLAVHPESDLADVAYSLQVGRKAFGYRQAILCRTASDAIERLGMEHPDQSYFSFSGSTKRPVVFMFPGAGAQHLRMAADLYASEPAFRRPFDRCCELLSVAEGVDLKAALYPEASDAVLNQAVPVLAGLFAVEYSLAQLWMEWDVQPESMIGHSLGEYVAACLSGVFRLEDALKIVAFRGRLFESLPPGAMLSVSQRQAEIEPYLSDEVSLAAVNAPESCVLSGSIDKLKELQKQLSARDIETRLLMVGRAGHSSFVTPIQDPFAKFVAAFELGPPRIPYISNYTGTWVKDSEATDPQYWADHFRHTVHFSQGLETLLLGSDRIFLEVGPGKTLSTLARQHNSSGERLIVSSMRHVKDTQSDVEVLLHGFAKLWTAGLQIDFPAFYSGQERRRISLPAYPFQGRRHWADAPAEQETVQPATGPTLLEYAPPRNDLETAIAHIWEDVLGVPSVSVDKKFCDMGGNESLLREMQRRMAQEFGESCRDGVTLTVTISELTDLVAEGVLEDISDEELSRTLGELDLPL